jgi:hypothetical protein
MLKRLSTISGSALYGALLILCVAVFTWGLHSKLSLYRAQGSQSEATIAKLSTEKNSSQTMAVVRRGSVEPVAWAAASSLYFPALALANTVAFFRPNQIRAPRGPCGCSWQGPDIMHRPPPMLA